MGDADPNAGGNHGRNVNQPMGSDFWTSTGKHCWDKAMKEYGHAFYQIGLEDLEGDNSLLILTLYVENVTTSPPTQKRGHGPYAAATVAKTMEHFINRICEKLFAPGQREQKKNELFPSAEVKALKKRCEDNTSQVLMQGKIRNSAFKTIFPIPREHNERTKIFEPHNIPEEVRRQGGHKVVDLLHIAEFLFKRERFTDLCQILFTHNGIGRGGKYDSIFLDHYYGVLFAMWFQRKVL